MLLGFKHRFEAFVLDGSKTHTIRAECKLSRKVGQRCDCYGDVRQKTMHLLGRWKCVKIEHIEIEGGWESHSGEFFGSLHIDGCRLDGDELNALAWRDGFRTNGMDGAFAEMMEFWRGRLPFKGIIIHWDYRQPVTIRRARGKTA